VFKLLGSDQVGFSASQETCNFKFGFGRKSTWPG